MPSCDRLFLLWPTRGPSSWSCSDDPFYYPQERDISGLEPLTTKAVRDAFEGTWQQYDAQGLSMKFEARAGSRPRRRALAPPHSASLG